MSDAPIFHDSTYVDDPFEIGAGTKIGHFVHVLPHTRIGAACVLGQNVMVGPHVTIGDRCNIQNNVALYKGVILEDDLFRGPSCEITNVQTPGAHVERKHEFSEPQVGTGATIGAHATFVCGNTLGAYCMIAAGAVVTKNVADHALMAGVPAIRIGWVSRSGDRLEGR